MSLFGTIVHKAQIEDACMAMLKARLPTYLDEVAEQIGEDRGHFPSPKSWLKVREFDTWPEDALPSVMLISPGMVDDPVRHGDGIYTGRWYIATAVIVAARTEKATHDLAGIYSAALRACMLQNRSLEGALDGKARVVRWISEEYDKLPKEDERALGAGANIFHVQVDDIVSADAGPTEWLDDVDGHSPSYGDLPTADPEKLAVDVTHIEEA